LRSRVVWRIGGQKSHPGFHRVLVDGALVAEIVGGCNGLRVSIEELAVHLGYGTVIVCNAIDTDLTEALFVKQRFLKHLEKWQQKYLSGLTK
jgi:hypothetical protein